MQLITEGTVINYETRYLLILLAAIINQDKVKNPRRQVNWEMILKLAEYHYIVNPIYYGMLGIEKAVSKDCAERFYQKYKKELLLGESYIQAEEVIIWQLERHKIHALLLWGSEQYNYYSPKELEHKEKIEIIVERKYLPQIHRMMREMDYERIEDRLGNSLIYTRTPGIRIAFYSQLPIGNKVLKDYFKGSIKDYTYVGKKKYIHRLVEKEIYLYLTGRLVELFVVGELRARDIADWRQYRKKLSESFPWKETKYLLEKAKLEEFIHQIELLSLIWFDGSGEAEEWTTALELEEYIFLQREDNRWLEEKILPYERMRLDFYRRDREKEWTKKRKEWYFPSREYMSGLFPVLNKAPFLLWLFWLVRTVRILKNRWSRELKNRWMGIKLKLGDLIRRRNVGEGDAQEEIDIEKIYSEETDRDVGEKGRKEGDMEQTDREEGENNKEV